MERVINIVDYHQRKNNSQIIFTKNIPNHIPKCPHPWNSMVVDQNGLVYLCVSPAWLPKSIGSILDYDNIYDLLNSYEARAIRSEIDLNRYSYCNNKICEYLSNRVDIIETEETLVLTEEQFTESSRVNTLPTSITFAFDYTCNFKCPSCRVDIINNNSGKVFKSNQLLVEKIKSVLLDNYKDFTNQVIINWAGGEPFVSKAYLSLWKHISLLGNNNIRNIIQTNGSYLKKRSKLLNDFLPYVDAFRISFDAGTPNTYKDIRVNGDWNSLLENSKFIKKLIDQSGFNIKIISDFVTQLDNYKEIPNYISITKSLGFDKTNINKMWNWGTWTMDEFEKLNVTNPQHPHYKDLVNILIEYENDSQLVQNVY